MVSLTVDIDFSTVYYNQLFFLVIARKNDLLGLVDATNKFECDFVLEVDSKIGQEEYALFNDSDVGFEDKLVFE